MRALVAAVAVVVVGACTTEDPRPVRPPGGGGPGGGTGGDDVDAAPPGDGGVALTGTVCVVDRLDAPTACPATPQRIDVLVEALGVGSTRSDDAGEFTLDTTADAVVLEVGGEAGDGLITTRTRVDVASTAVDGFVVDEIAWGEALNQLLETQLTGAVLAYVVDANGPVVGATVSVDGGVPAGARRYYDDSAGGFDPNGVETGQDGMALFLDVAQIQVTAVEGARSASAVAPTTDGGVGIVFLELP